MEKRLLERITEFDLDNGLHFIVMERHSAPIVSVHTYANVGAFDEVDGQTGKMTCHESANSHFRLVCGHVVMHCDSRCLDLLRHRVQQGLPIYWSTWPSRGLPE